MSALLRTLFASVLIVSAQPGACQSFVYVEPGIASCPTVPAPAAVAAKLVQPGVAVAGRISVSCGFDQGSYTVALSSTDPGATFAPKTFLVNFGRLVGDGVYTVRFSTVGVQTVSATITSNMGSPVVRGHFAGTGNEFNVVSP